MSAIGGSSATLAQARAGMAGGPSNPELLLMEGCWPVFLHRSLGSSRALERFRNQVPVHAGVSISMHPLYLDMCSDTSARLPEKPVPALPGKCVHNGMQQPRSVF
jgi:hypothetical protein